MNVKCALLASVLASVACSLAQAQDPKCQVKRDQFVNGGRANGSMKVEQNGVCEFKFRFGGTNPPDSWNLVTPPKSGKVAFKEGIAEYRPNEGFVGDDKFTIALFGKTPNCGTRCNRNGQYEISVQVLPK
jgi:hypothetical protein